MVKLQPYKQISISQQVTTKLFEHFYGLFRVIRRISASAYEMELPTSSKIHNLFHVSLSKKVRHLINQTLALPDEAIDNHPLIYHLAIISI